MNFNAIREFHKKVAALRNFRNIYAGTLQCDIEAWSDLSLICTYFFQNLWNKCINNYTFFTKTLSESRLCQLSIMDLQMSKKVVYISLQTCNSRVVGHKAFSRVWKADSIFMLIILQFSAKNIKTWQFCRLHLLEVYLHISCTYSKTCIFREHQIFAISVE